MSARMKFRADEVLLNVSRDFGSEESIVEPLMHNFNR